MSIDSIASPRTKLLQGGPLRGGSAEGRIAESGSTRDADHAGASDASTAMAPMPATAAKMPSKPTAMPSVKTWSKMVVNPKTKASPSGTPMATPSPARSSPSPTTLCATCVLVAPMLRSIAKRSLPLGDAHAERSEHDEGRRQQADHAAHQRQQVDGRQAFVDGVSGSSQAEHAPALLLFLEAVGQPRDDLLNVTALDQFRQHCRDAAPGRRDGSAPAASAAGRRSSEPP